MSDPETQAAPEVGQVSVEHDGVILTGVDTATEQDLRQSMARHQPDVLTAPETTPEPPKPSRGQKRFDELTREREDQRRRADAAEARAKELEARLAQPPRPEPTREPEPTPPATRPTKELLAKMPADLKTFDAYLAKYPDAEYEEFRDERNLWLTAQTQPSDIDAKIRQSIEADRASRSRADLVTQAVTRGRAAYQDFDAVLTAAHMTEPWPQDKIEAIASMEQPEHIQYALGKDPDLAHRLKGLGPVQFGMELAKLVTAAPGASPASPTRTVVTPPAPYQPVAGGGSTVAQPSAALAARAVEDYDSSGYREKRARERGVKAVY